MQHFADRLAQAVKHKGTPALVGLDPRLGNLPPALADSVDGRDFPRCAEAFRRFCCEVVDVIAPLAPAVKPQAAFFEQLGPAGMQALHDVISYAREKDLLVILDGKRNDIGSTAAAYADAYLGAPPAGAWGADALTVSPYLGDDSLAPFVDTAIERGAGLFVLVKTSNPGGGLFQDLSAQGRPLYEHVACHVETLAAKSAGRCGYGVVGAVVGATYPSQLAALRSLMPHAWFLVPGFGAQGGAAKDVAGAFDQQGLGAIVNSSRGVIFAYERPPYSEQYTAANWQRAVEAAARDMIDQLRSETPAGGL